MGAHFVLAMGFALVLLAFPDSGLGWLLALGPMGLGLTQAWVLRRRLPRWASLLWPMATGLGWVVSLVFAGWMYPLLGLAFGLCQMGLLAAGRFRWWGLWPGIGGASWASALLLGGWLGHPDPTWVPIQKSTVGFVSGSTLLAYALATGLALRWMGRKPAPQP